MQYIKNNLLLIIGIIVGSLAGFFYWKYVGCSSGRCLITSRPVNATIYGAILGGLLFSIFKPNKK